MTKLLIILIWIALALIYYCSFKSIGGLSVYVIYNHQPLQNATVHIPELNYYGTTSEKGELKISSTLATHYKLIISKQNFTTVIVSDLIVRPGKITYISTNLDTNKLNVAFTGIFQYKLPYR